jgi:hypothetical protein
MLTAGTNSPNFGKHLPKEQCEKISKALTGEKHPFFGEKHTEQSKNKMQQNNRLRVLTTENVLNIRELYASEKITQKKYC